jgi:hypothetical protein
MAMNMVGTPYSAVQRSCSTAIIMADRLEGLEDDHGAAVVDRCQHAQHAPEAVEQGHRQAAPGRRPVNRWFSPIQKPLFPMWWA